MIRSRSELITLVRGNADAPAAPGYEAMNVRELREHAAAVGFNADAVEDARDSDDPRSAITALIKHAQGGRLYCTILE